MAVVVAIGMAATSRAQDWRTDIPRSTTTPDRVESIMGHTPANRFGEAHELIGATLLLASDAAGSFITGTEMIVDGGFSCMTI